MFKLIEVAIFFTLGFVVATNYPDFFTDVSDVFESVKLVFMDVFS
jgi:hypothetical protein